MATPSSATSSKRPTTAAASTPRSVASPVAARHAAPKTPVASSHHHHPSSATKTTPMMHSLSQGASSASPTNTIATHNPPSFTPTGLGIDTATPANLHFPTPPPINTPSATTGPFQHHHAKANEDDDRRARMHHILHTIGTSRPRIAEDGITRTSRRVGFANDVDAEKLSPAERDRKVGNRALAVAGNTVLIEIDLKAHQPRSVSVTHSVSTDALARDAARAADVLLADLKPLDGVALLNAKLDRFALNLDSLARLDRLSSNRINCFEALSGVYTSLRRLYDVELEAANAVFAANAARKASMEVMCKKSGRPEMHARGRLGLELAYWQQGRFVASGGGNVNSGSDSANNSGGGTSNIASSNGGVMDTGESTLENGGEADAGQQRQDEEQKPYTSHDQVFALRIEAEASSAAMYPSLRVSDAWLPETFQVPSDNNIPWREPPPTFLSADSAGDAMAVDGEQKLPDIRFVARLDPPLVMPWPIAVHILASVGLPQPPMMAIPPPYAAALLLDPSTPAADHTHTQPSVFVSSRQTVLSPKHGSDAFVTHSYFLSSARPDFSFRLVELPFSHPRQLIELLPVLRQWACAGALLRQAFPSTSNRSTSPSATHPTPPPSPPRLLNDLLNFEDLGLENIQIQDIHAQHAQAQDHQTQSSRPKNPGRPNNIPVSIALTTAPIPTFGLIFPRRESVKNTSVEVQILPNAELAVTSYDGLGGGDAFTKQNDFAAGGGADDADADEDAEGEVDPEVEVKVDAVAGAETVGRANDGAVDKARTLARVLDVVGEVGVWVEWMREWKG